PCRPRASFARKATAHLALIPHEAAGDPRLLPKKSHPAQPLLERLPPSAQDLGADGSLRLGAGEELDRSGLHLVGVNERVVAAAPAARSASSARSAPSPASTRPATWNVSTAKTPSGEGRPRRRRRDRSA